MNKICPSGYHHAEMRSACMAAWTPLGRAWLISPNFITTNRLGYAVPLLMFLAVVFWNFFRCFQKNNDFRIVLLALDLLVAGFCWFRPLSSWQKAISLGLFGGIWP